MATLPTAMGGHDMDMATVAMVKMDTTVDTDITAGKGTGISSTWRQRLLMSKQLNPTLRPL